MSTLQFSGGANFVKLVVLSEARGDAKVTVQVQSAGFIGQSELWIQNVRAFCISLAALNQTLRGKASLASVSDRPDEKLDLQIASADLLGHVAIFGSTGYYVWTSPPVRNYWHAVHFGFEFEPQQLAAAVATPWVQRNLR